MLKIWEMAYLFPAAVKEGKIDCREDAAAVNGRHEDDFIEIAIQKKSDFKSGQRTFYRAKLKTQSGL